MPSSRRCVMSRKKEPAVATAKPTAKRAKPRHLEAVEQRMFVKRFRMDPRTRDLPACAIPNGGKRGAREAALMKAEGVSAGAPDWLCMQPSANGRFVACAIEMKSPNGNGGVSDAQRHWHAMLRARGWNVAVCMGADAAWSFVAEHLGLTP